MNVTKELIINHFGGKTSPLQRAVIDEWLLVTDHEELYYFWLEEWENNNLQYLADTESEIKRVAFSVGEKFDQPEASKPGHDAGERRGRAQILKWISIAAMTLLLGGVWIWRDLITYKHYRTGFGQVTDIALEDGTEVKLKTNSLLRVPRFGFGSDSREVYLDGEANFNVTHQANHQSFVVTTDKNLKVVVLGTEFNMYARKHNSRVILNKGKVQVLYQQDNVPKKILMKPGELISIDDKNGVRMRKTEKLKEYFDGQEKRFVFEETSLEEVAYLLQENYGFEVTIMSKGLADRVLMGSFRAENADELLKSISELLDVNVIRQGNKVQLSDR